MEHADRPRTRDEFNRRLEEEATRLLAESIREVGRGDYPFFSATYLREMAQKDAGVSAAGSEASAPPAPQRSLTTVWRLARKARLSSLENDLLRLVMDGTELVAAAEILAITRRRAIRLLRTAVERIEGCARQAQLSVGEQVAQVYHEEVTRRGYSPERHCRPGREACRRTGVCTFRRAPGEE
jgi:hypothetical protein